MPVRRPSTAVVRRLVTSPILVLGLIAAVMVPASALGVQRYHDVKPTHRFASAINWASSEGLTDGCKTAPEESDLAFLSAAEAEMPGFCPGAPVTRAQLMEVLYRYDRTVVGQPGPAGPAGPQGPQGPAGAAGAAACQPFMGSEALAIARSAWFNGRFGPSLEVPKDYVAPLPSDVLVDCTKVVTPAQTGCLSFLHVTAAMVPQLDDDDFYFFGGGEQIFFIGAPACFEMLGISDLLPVDRFLP